MKYCNQCGSPMEDDCRFCPACGTDQGGFAAAPTPSAPQDGQPAPAPKRCKSNKKMLLLLIGIGAALVLILALCLVLANCSSCGARGALRNYLYYTSGNRCANINTLFPADAWDTLEDDSDFYKDDARDLLEEQQEDNEENEISYAYEIKSIKSIDLDEFEDACGSTLKYWYGIDVDDITAAKKIRVRITVTQDGERDSETDTVYAYKYGGLWYIVY